MYQYAIYWHFNTIRIYINEYEQVLYSTEVNLDISVGASLWCCKYNYQINQTINVLCKRYAARYKVGTLGSKNVWKYVADP